MAAKQPSEKDKKGGVSGKARKSTVARLGGVVAGERGPRPPTKKLGRPVGNTAYTPQDYINALRASDGIIAGAAKLLNVNPTSVVKMCDRYPEVAEARGEYRLVRIGVAQSVVNEMMSPKNPDRNTKLRASMYTLSRESPDHNPTLNVGVGASTTLPPLIIQTVQSPHVNASAPHEIRPTITATSDKAPYVTTVDGNPVGFANGDGNEVGLVNPWGAKAVNAVNAVSAVSAWQDDDDDSDDDDSVRRAQDRDEDYADGGDDE